MPWQTFNVYICFVRFFKAQFRLAGSIFFQAFFISQNYTKGGWFRWFVQRLEMVRNALSWHQKDAPTMAGFAMKQWRTATAVIEQWNFKLDGTVRHARIRHWNGKTETVTWHLTFPQLRQRKKWRSIRSKLPKELADKPACDQTVNPAHQMGGVFF